MRFNQKNHIQMWTGPLFLVPRTQTCSLVYVTPHLSFFVTQKAARTGGFICHTRHSYNIFNLVAEVHCIFHNIRQYVYDNVNVCLLCAKVFPTLVLVTND